MTTTIQAAIDDASANDIVLVPTGTYTGDGNKELDFGGKNITLISASGPESTTIDCENDGRGFHFHSEENNNSVISGFTIENGNADNGGGIYINGSSPTIRHCILYKNTADSGGGVHVTVNQYIHHRDGFTPKYWVIGSSPIIEDCRLERNTSESGAALYLYDKPQSAVDALNAAGFLDRHVVGYAQVKRCRMLRNARYIGQAVYLSTIEAEFTSCVIAGNRSRGVKNSLGKLTMRNCTIAENIYSGWGSGVYASHFGSIPGHTRLYNTIVWGNTTEDHQVYALVDNNLCQLDYVCHNNSYPDVYGVQINHLSISSPGNNVVADPLLCRNGNLNLGSPCNSAGSPLYAPSTDVEGEPMNPSIGADKYIDDDNNGLSNEFEIKHFKRKTGSDPSSNPDNDELTTEQEYEAGTSPTRKVPDEDNDNLSGDTEIYNGSDNDNWDTDGNLFDDEWESKYDFHPANPGDPAKDVDSDGDGLKDFDEMRNGTSPRETDSDGDGASDGDEIRDGSDPADPADGGDPGKCISIELTIGDHSGSHSERYGLIIERGDGKPPIKHVSPEFGKLDTKKYNLLVGKEYVFRVQWLANDPDAPANPRPDYDYTAKIGGLTGSGNGLGFRVEDAYEVLGVHSESSENYADGKSGILYTIGCDLDGKNAVSGLDLPELDEGLVGLVVLADSELPQAQLIVRSCGSTGWSRKVTFLDVDTVKVDGVVKSEIIVAAPSDEDAVYNIAQNTSDGAWSVSDTHVATLTVEKDGQSYTDDILLKSVRVALSSEKAEESPRAFPWGNNSLYDPKALLSASDSEMLREEKRAIDSSLVIYYKDVIDAQGNLQDFDIQLKGGPGLSAVAWLKDSGPDASGTLVNDNQPEAIFRNPTKGGRYIFELHDAASATVTRTQIWLPVAGPDITQYWTNEIDRIKAWGVNYRAKLHERSGGSIAQVLSPSLYTFNKEKNRRLDFKRFGLELDWETPKEPGDLYQTDSPCGLGNISTETFSAGDMHRFTMYGRVIDYAKRNNMGYALVAKEMGISDVEVIKGPEWYRAIENLKGGVVKVGSQDASAALESYEAGIDLHNGISLEIVINNRGAKMLHPGMRAEKEWPSHEVTSGTLIIKDTADDAMQTLLK